MAFRLSLSVSGCLSTPPVSLSPLAAPTSPRADSKTDRPGTAPGTRPRPPASLGRIFLFRAGTAAPASGRRRPSRRSRCGLRCGCPGAGRGGPASAGAGSRRGLRRGLCFFVGGGGKRKVGRRGRERERNTERFFSPSFPTLAFFPPSHLASSFACRHQSHHCGEEAGCFLLTRKRKKKRRATSWLSS